TMKHTLAILFLLLFAGAAQAQTNSKYVQIMEKSLAGMDTLKTTEEWQARSNAFERIAQKENKEWLPPYYVALCQAMIFNFEKDATKQEALTNKAEQFIAKADSLMPNNSEVYVVKSMVTGMRIRLNPMVNGQKYGMMAGMYLEKAKSLDPTNPRAYTQEGITTYFTPAQWGGSKEKGKELLKTADEKYEAFKPASTIAPSWGKVMNDYILEMVEKG
ncbi:MAG: hypothetical protein ABIO24_05090, partial [Saprospiraceae bacterium]